jgi:hypothetical protein
VFIAVNRWDNADSIPLPDEFKSAEVLYGSVKDGNAIIPPHGVTILKI